MKIFCVSLFALLSVSLSACTRESRTPPASATLDPREALAQCLRDRGVTLYSASWCHFCQRQAELFGPAAYARVPTVECSPPGTRGQAPACREAGIEGYPTWVFPNGTRNAGLMSLEELAEASGCSYTPP